MFKSIMKVLELPIISKLITRLVNRYTASGIIIVAMQLEHIGILPIGVTKSVEGLPSKELLIYLALAVGIYLIFHTPKLKSRLEKIKEEIEIEKAKKELRMIKEERDGSKPEGG